MKKIFSLFLCLCFMVCGLSACSNSDNDRHSENSYADYYTAKKDDSEEYICPDFLGMTIEEAKKEYGDRFNLVFPDGEEWMYSEDYEFGEICDQSIEEGANLRKNAKIEFTISKGADTTTVPDINGKDELVALEELEMAGLLADAIRIENDLPKGTVIKTNPRAGTICNKGDKVEVYVSEGPGL